MKAFAATVDVAVGTDDVDRSELKLKGEEGWVNPFGGNSSEVFERDSGDRVVREVADESDEKSEESVEVKEGKILLVSLKFVLSLEKIVSSLLPKLRNLKRSAS